MSGFLKFLWVHLVKKLPNLREGKKEMKYYLEWAFSTWFGLMCQKKYCPIWDKKLNELLDKYSDTAKLWGYSLVLGVNEIRVSNRFYSYGNLITQNTRPSVKTMIRLAKLEDSLRAKIAEGDLAMYIKEMDKIK